MTRSSIPAANLLTDDGVMLLHTIGCSDAPGLTNPWLTRYIFPGGHLPSLSDIVSVVERSGLVITDIEILRLHYAETLKAWRANFMARRDEAVAMFDERFCRMWEYYLSMAEAAFRFDKVVIFQIQLARRNDIVPPSTQLYHRRREPAQGRSRSRHEGAAIGVGR